jgi:phenylalanyl-tRNA synthetase beta chain
VRFNLNRKLARVRVFEVGRCFLRCPNAPEGELEVAGLRQPMRIGGIAYGSAFEPQWGQDERAVDFFDVKGDVEALVAPLELDFIPAGHPALHPGRAARLELDGQPIGWIGELHPRLQQKYELPGVAVAFELDAEPLTSTPRLRYTEISKFPAVTRDLALIVDAAVPAAAMLEALRAERLAVVQDIRLFDLFRGANIEKNRKSLAFRVVMQDTARTLTDAEVDAAVAQLKRILTDRFGAEERT